MRTDYPLYVVAIVCFIIAIYAYAAPLAETELYIYSLVVIGIIFIGLGYIARPKGTTLSITKTSPPKPELSVELPAQPKTEQQEESTNAATKKTAQKKKTTRRRRKKT